jgi:hypothetical protein
LNPTRRQLPYNLAFGTDEPLFKVMQRPENSYNRKRFAVAMRGTAALDPPDLILQGTTDSIIIALNLTLTGFEWGLLPSGGIVVDVGAGIGHASLTIAQKHPTLHIINQDLAPAVELSRTVSEERKPRECPN